ncbi:MAG: hypothetical protein QM756_08360 [Polyangiaceae bacterium]
MSMFEIIVDDAFARWFEGLAPAEAELVAAELELVAAAGPRVDPRKQSRLLLWFDDMPAPLVAQLEFSTVSSARLWLERYRELLDWQVEALRYLEMPEFSEALCRLDTPAAERALRSVEELRRSVQATRQAFLSALCQSPVAAKAPLAPERAMELRVERVKGGLSQALADVGLDLDELANRELGLREMTLGEGELRLRVLYALDPKRKRLLALLGERLDRTYYGDSVRFAERRFREYRAREFLGALAPAEVREDA